MASGRVVWPFIKSVIGTCEMKKMRKAVRVAPVKEGILLRNGLLARLAANMAKYYKPLRSAEMPKSEMNGKKSLR